MNIDSVINALDLISQKRIAVFGDFVLDKYLYSDPERDEVSVETGLMAYQIDRKDMQAGVAGCTVNNLRGIGADAVAVGIIGNDGEGFELLRAMHKNGINTEHIVKSENIITNTYVKPMRKKSLGEYVEINRLDFRNFQPLCTEDEDKLLSQLRTVVKTVDCVVTTDQYNQRNTGAVTDRVRGALCSIAKDNPDVVFYIDSREFLGEYENHAMKCNNYEFVKAFCSGKGDPEDIEMLVAEGRKVRAKYKKPLFITCGKSGILAISDETYLVPAHPVPPPVDTVGAGEACNAAIGAGLACGLEPWEAAVLACCVSSITVQQIGTTGTATIPQLKERLLSYKQNYSQDIRKI